MIKEAELKFFKKKILNDFNDFFFTKKNIPLYTKG